MVKISIDLKSLVSSVYLPVTLSCYISYFIFVFGELNGVWFIEFIWSGRRRECLGGCWYTSGGLNFNVTTVHFWIEFYLQFSNGQNEFIDQLYDLDDLFASKSPLVYQGPCLWSSFVKHLKIKNFLTIKVNVWPILVVHMGSIFLFWPICR